MPYFGVKELSNNCMRNSKHTEDHITMFMQFIEYTGSPLYKQLPYSIRDRTVYSIRSIYMLSATQFLIVLFL